MLSVLRRIRRSLIEEGHLNKYLAYAIGEILLVMIGILLALQINAWNTARLNRNLEREYLQRLRIDLKITENNVELQVQRWKVIAEATDFLIKAIEDPSFNPTSARLAIALTRMALIQVPAIVDTTFEDLQATGNIRLIRDQAIRDEIAQLYDVTLQNGRPFLESRMDLRARRIAFQLLPPYYYKAAHELCPLEISIYHCPEDGEVQVSNLEIEIRSIPDFVALLKVRRWDQEIGINIFESWHREIETTLSVFQ